jgi:hypothetical protein
MVVSAVRVVAEQDCHDCPAFFSGRGIYEAAPDSGRLNFGKPSSRRVEPPLEFLFPALVQRVCVTVG